MPLLVALDAMLGNGWIGLTLVSACAERRGGYFAAMILFGQALPIAVLAVPAMFVCLTLAEMLVPALPADRRRWPLNLLLGVANTLILRLLTAIGPIAAAHWAAGQNMGLFNYIHWPTPALAVANILLLDLAIYWQHRAFHRWHWGWALHRLHHADTMFDVTTGVRFHPGEALLSLFYKSAIVILLGVPPAIVLAFELYLTLFSLIEHANIRLPVRWEGNLRRFWVTPAMHRIHHSAHGGDHNHNYGFALALWDHLFGSYQSTASGPRIGTPT
jgi:sterol desaturase/sphingolipid hydroxylase (fatty acid hydroxylase superfamily)